MMKATVISEHEDKVIENETEIPYPREKCKEFGMELITRVR